MRVLIACGGTGGHINPGLAIAGTIAAHKPDTEFLFAGTPNGMEAELVPAAGYKIEFVKVAGFQRDLSLDSIKRNVKAVGYLMTAGSRSKEIIRNFKPDLAIGTGGYAAGPVIRAAQQLGIPTALHEQNAFAGVTNKLLSKKADAVMVNFEAAKQYFPDCKNVIVTGLPVRGAIKKRSREQARQMLGFSDGMTILSFGGSQGAKCLNDLMPDLMAWHLNSDMKINHIHAYGKNGKDTFNAMLLEKGVKPEDTRIRVSEYIHDMDVCLAAADVVICRAGASTLSELEAVGRASVLIPYPTAAENHQYHNAMVLGKAGAAMVIEQKDLTLERLKNAVAHLYEEPEKRMLMGQRAGALALTDVDERIWAVLEPLLARKKA
ncbi:MAG: undecaprenyldiphospho-muramoylpentapeptide beta-N-acetylglucosaminyltransferase [Oscillospiraceae bacterium]|nr:undecaprenyldiphospho-muramoylpentapeptide beta-N-acetylglucosaminyltransferase [Oscillospiraceae bacterium]